MKNALRLNYEVSISGANGPGSRYTIWVQGCSIQCPGCMNVDTWDPSAGYIKSIDEIVNSINETKGIDGVTITGGEPLDQFEAVYELCFKLFKTKSLFLTTGYKINEILRNYFKILQVLDIICIGPFDQNKKCSGQWKGSSNQEVIYLTPLGEDQFKEFPVISEEIIIDEKGSVLKTGFSPKI